MQHLQRGPERVHLCQRNKPKSCHIEIKHTKVQQSRFVVTIISRDRLCSRCVISVIHSEHVPAATKSDTVIEFPKQRHLHPLHVFAGNRQFSSLCLRHVIDFTALPFTEQKV